jgi:hypothetical protein
MGVAHGRIARMKSVAAKYEYQITGAAVMLSAAQQWVDLSVRLQKADIGRHMTRFTTVDMIPTRIRLARRM